MLAVRGAVICLAYILGLLFAGVAGQVGRVPGEAIGLLVAGAIFAFFIPRCWRTGPKAGVWLVAGFVAGLATLYFQWKVPHPQPTDISQVIFWGKGQVAAVENVAPEQTDQTDQTFRITGQIHTSPRLTQSQRIQFELEAEQMQTAPLSGQFTHSSVTGSVYVTVPLLQGTGLYPGQKVTVTGRLYKPKPAANPGGFDFAKYLAQQGIFAGLNGKQVEVANQQPAPSILWTIRQKIIRAQVAGLGVPEGPIVSAMVMGGRSVDVPHLVREQFRIAGLAHALAASGAQVSLLIGVVLTLTQRLSAKLRLILGLSVLLLYLCLTGFEASILRAGIMGAVALLALTIERKVKPLPSTLFAATLLLLFNPLWIRDLGFQLSFLATLGLLVTVPVLTRWLDWMPSAITPLFTVPIAAYIWTLPLLMFVFGVVSPYSILINVLVSPLIMVISIGGMMSALAALIYPLAGSGLAGLLYYPTHLFIQIADWGSQLPGGAWAVGTITIVQLVLLYGLIGLIWVWHKLQRYWWAAVIVGISLVMLPAWYASTHLLQATVLATASQPVLVFQERGRVALLNAGSESDVKFTVLPFLQKQGINQIDWALDPNIRNSDLEGWQRVLANLPIREFYSHRDQTLETQTVDISDRTASVATTHQLWLTQLQSHQSTTIPFPLERALPFASATIQILSQNPTILQIRFADQTWLLLPDRSIPMQSIPAQSIPAQSALTQLLPTAQVLWWTGGELSPDLLETIQPKIAIASARSIAAQTQTWLQSHHVTLFVTDRDGAIQWTPEQGFRAVLEAEG